MAQLQLKIDTTDIIYGEFTRTEAKVLALFREFDTEIPKRIEETEEIESVTAHVCLLIYAPLQISFREVVRNW